MKVPAFPATPESPMDILVIGATGSIGRLVVEEALREGHRVRALARDPARARGFDPRVQVVPGDVTRPAGLAGAILGIDAIVFTLGSDGQGRAGAESIDYGGVRNVLRGLEDQTPRIALMTSIGVTNRTGSYNRSTQAHDRKRRSERLVRASGLHYTIVRPGWFDANAADELKLDFLQGDARQAGNPSDGAVARRQVAATLVRSLRSASARGKTFELVATRGHATQDFDTLFAALEPDKVDTLDAARDASNMPMEQEPQGVRDDLDDARRAAPSTGFR
jgi:uncharacterized protein YbjT (DUF2867 family)